MTPTPPPYCVLQFNHYRSLERLQTALHLTKAAHGPVDICILQELCELLDWELAGWKITYHHPYLAPHQTEDWCDLAIATRPGLEHLALRTSLDASVCVVDVGPPEARIRIINTYWCIPPQGGRGLLGKDLEELSLVLNTNTTIPIIIASDFNADGGVWSAIRQRTSCHTTALEDWIVNKALDIAMPFGLPTHTSPGCVPKTLDLTLHRNSAVVDPAAILADWPLADHTPVFFRITNSSAPSAGPSAPRPLLKQ